MPREFILPDLGEGITEAQIIRLLVKPGDTIKEDQYLMEVETDKAAVEIPSPYAGVARHIHVKEGETVTVGSVIVTFDDDGSAASAGGAAKSRAASAWAGSQAPVAASTAVASSAPVMVAESTAATIGRGKTTAPAAPAVRKIARELGVDINAIAGTGPGGRVTREDVERAKSGRSAASALGGSVAAPVTKGASAPAALSSRPQSATPLPGVPDQDKWGPIRREPLNQIRKTIANQMKKSAFTAVHVTHGDDADITDLDRLRRQLNEATNDDPKLTVMSFLIRATCIALRKYPIFNSSFDEEGGQIIYKDYVNIGIAVDTERGLIVPVIRDAERLTMRGIAAALRSIAERVRTNQFAVEDLRGGTFTITNVGALGGNFSTPIINFPEVAILGLGRTRKVPVLRGGQLAEALMLPLNLSFDHRATDGANAARFTGEIIGYLQTPAKFLLD